MERLDPNAWVDLLRDANADFERFFTRFAGVPVVGTDEELGGLLEIEQTLQAIRPLLNGRLQQSEDADVREELGLYRANLVRLRQELLNLQDSAGARRARLFLRQRNLEAAKAWCAASRATT